MICPNHIRIRGLFLGTAVGDSIGLPAEGISRRRNNRMFKGRWHHRFFLNRGMISDDTEHTVFVAQSLIAHPGSPERFAMRMAWCLKGWMMSLPAGIGLATLKSILRLWIGFSPVKSGVFSAGNGPSMRSAPIGVYFAGNREMMDRYLERSTRITHTDPKALTGASAVAYLAEWVMINDPSEKPDVTELEFLLSTAGPSDSDWLNSVQLIGRAASDGKSVSEFAEMLGLSRGVTGYTYHTVPMAIYCWYSHFGDFRRTIESLMDCGGDTDTAGAIAGALSGLVAGEEGIPEAWIDGIADWPRSISLLRRLSDVFAESIETPSNTSPVRYFWPGILPRNLFFLCIVLLHGFRRLFPPY